MHLNCPAFNHIFLLNIIARYVQEERPPLWFMHKATAVEQSVTDGWYIITKT